MGTPPFKNTFLNLFASPPADGPTRATQRAAQRAGAVAAGRPRNQQCQWAIFQSAGECVIRDNAFFNTKTARKWHFIRILAMRSSARADVFSI